MEAGSNSGRIKPIESLTLVIDNNVIKPISPRNKCIGKKRMKSKLDSVGAVHCTHPPRNTHVVCGGGSGVAACPGADTVLGHNMSIDRGSI